MCRDVREGVGLLEAQDRRFVLNGQHDGPERSVVFLLPAEADRIDFGVELYDREPEFRAVVEDCARRLLPHVGFDLRRFCTPPAPVRTTYDLRTRRG